MTGAATVSIYCPPMKITPVNRKLRRTALEPMTVTIQMPDGTQLVFQNVTIPETDVHAIHWPRHWMVDPCKAENGDDRGNYVIVSLPQEPVDVHLLAGYSVALAIDATITLMLASGPTHTGTVTFPDCKTPLSTGIAESVTATGIIPIG